MKVSMRKAAKHELCKSDRLVLVPDGSYETFVLGQIIGRGLASAGQRMATTKLVDNEFECVELLADELLAWLQPSLGR